MFDTVFAYSSNGTPVYNEGGHPHFDNEIAIEAINHMVIPAVPADPEDRNQTRVCETYDFGRVIGVNHRVEKNRNDIIFLLDRGIEEPRGYQSWMVLKPCAEETKLTTVVVWFNEHWVLLTNHEGEEDLYPEPGTKRYEMLDEIDRQYARAWHYNNPLSPKPNELEKAIAELEKEIADEEDLLCRWEYAMLSLEYNSRASWVDGMKEKLEAMKNFRKYAK